MYRAEDKYACNATELYMLQARIDPVLRPDSNQYDETGYSIVSVYFDDFTDSHLMDTIAGNSERDKYRIRIYNHSFDTIKLEVKSKQYNRILKKSKTITYDQMQNLLNGKCIEDSGSFDDPATLFNISIKEHGLTPKIIVAYERKAYVFDAGNVRITFDRNIRASKYVDFFGNPGTIYDPLIENDMILEVKYNEFLPGFIAQLLELGNMQQTSFSKYKLCREMYMRGDF